MIAMLRGVLDSAGEDSAIVDVGGVGYLVFCSRRTLGAISRRPRLSRLALDEHDLARAIAVILPAIERDLDRVLLELA